MRFRVLRASRKQRRITSRAFPITDPTLPVAVLRVISQLFFHAGLLSETANLHEAVSRINRASRRVPRNGLAHYGNCRRSKIEIPARRRHEEPRRIGVLWFSIRVWRGGQWASMEIVSTLDEGRRLCAPVI